MQSMKSYMAPVVCLLAYSKCIRHTATNQPIRTSHSSLSPHQPPIRQHPEAVLPTGSANCQFAFSISDLGRFAAWRSYAGAVEPEAVELAFATVQSSCDN